jgi:hypothetical protein
MPTFYSNVTARQMQTRRPSLSSKALHWPPANASPLVCGSVSFPSIAMFARYHSPGALFSLEYIPFLHSFFARPGVLFYFSIFSFVLLLVWSFHPRVFESSKSAPRSTQASLRGLLSGRPQTHSSGRSPLPSRPRSHPIILSPGNHARPESGTHL